MEISALAQNHGLDSFALPPPFPVMNFTSDDYQIAAFFGLIILSIICERL